ncbi:HAD family hydrolase [Bifidobacterium favimelis]|uniref:HAD family phosphatase n=1 Tax=Bifidobacterium favimelis TaxID=3122979 RepID=A0ABU8ZMF0_9BIFI
MKGWRGEVDVTPDIILSDEAATCVRDLPIKNVIFDFGNVLIYWKPETAMIGRYSSQAIEAMLDNDRSGFFDANDIMDGGGTCAQALEWVREHKGSPWDEMFSYYCANFQDSLDGPVPGARKLVGDLKAAGIGVWGLSNWGSELFPIAWRRFPILHGLDGLVVSGPIHMRKPDPVIFKYALDRFGVGADGCLFVDDKGMNVVGANKAGIRGYRFTDPDRLRDTLIGAGIGIPPLI